MADIEDFDLADGEQLKDASGERTLSTIDPMDLLEQHRNVVPTTRPEADRLKPQLLPVLTYVTARHGSYKQL